MTWSIVARDPETGAFAVAVTTRFFAVGAICPFGRSGMGAVSTQALVNPLYGPRALHMMEDGISPDLAVPALTGSDNGRDNRQLHMIDAKGRIAAYTGAKCIDWAGQVQSDNVSVAGNMLSGPQVIEKTLETYLAQAEKPFAERLLNALDAGEDAGGDKRGRQSAALKIWTTEEYPWLDLRVDDHSEPLAELRRLYAVAQERYLYVMQVVPKRDNPHGTTDRTHIDDQIAAREKAMKDRGEQSASHATTR